MPKFNPGITILNQYQILQYIGTNRWGERYKAVRLLDQRAVDLQCLDKVASIRKESVDLIFSVVTPMVGIVHKHIVEVFGCGVDATTRMPFVAQAWTEGQTLAELITRKFPVGAPPTTVRRIVTPIAAMLDEVQDHFFHGFIHPRCIYVSSIGRVKVSEFGWLCVLSEHIDPNLLLEPSDKPFLAPEYARTKPDHRADVYSLAQVVHVLLSGRPAPSDGTPDLKEELPHELKEALQLGLLPDPELRHATTGALLEALRISLLSGKKTSKSVMVLDLLRSFSDDVDEKKYMVQKGRLDYGPYSGQEIREKLCEEEILPDHIVVTIATGLRKKALQHPDFTDFVHEYQRRMELKRREEAERQTTVAEKRQSRTLKLTVLLGLVGIAAVATSIVLYQTVTSQSSGRGKRSLGGDQDVAVETDASDMNSSNAAMKTTTRKKRTTSRGSGSGPGGGYAGEEIKVYALDNLELPRSVINSIVNRDVIMRISSACIPPTGTVLINYQIDGRRGRIRFVSATLEGKPNPNIASCAFGILKQLEFPQLDTDLSGSGTIRY